MNTLEALASTLTLKELAAKTGCPVESIVKFAMNKTPKPKSMKTTNGKVSDVGVFSRSVDTKSPKAREEYDQEVYAVLERRNDWMRAADLRREVGGSPLQIRTSLNRLVESEKVTFQGKARATTYKVTPR